MSQPQQKISVALLCAVTLASCTDSREQRSRRATQRLGQATPSSYEQALAAVVANGSYALPDIEQQLHEAEPTQRLYLLEALRQIGDAEAIPLLRFWSRWADQPRVKRKAREVLEELTREGKHRQT